MAINIKTAKSLGIAARAFDQRASHRYAALHAGAHSDATGDRSYNRDLGRAAQGVLECDRVRFWAATGGDHSAAASHPCRDSGVAMTAQIAIRPLRLDERVAWEPLWKGYLDFYRITAPQETYDTTWARLHDPNEPMWLLGGYVDGKLLGIVHYIYHRSCWTIGDYCYLQDLFVAEGARKLGLGRALIEAVYEAARAAGASRVHWLTHETNAVARSLYDTLADRPGFIQYRRLF